MTAVPWCECFFLLDADAADSTDAPDRAAVKADNAGDRAAADDADEGVAFALNTTEQ